MKKKIFPLVLLTFLNGFCIFAKGNIYNSKTIQPLIEQFLNNGSYIKIGTSYPRYLKKDVIVDIYLDYEVLYITTTDNRMIKYDLSKFTFSMDGNNIVIN